MAVGHVYHFMQVPRKKTSTVTFHHQCGGGGVTGVVRHLAKPGWNNYTEKKQRTTNEKFQPVKNEGTNEIVKMNMHEHIDWNPPLAATLVDVDARNETTVGPHHFDDATDRKQQPFDLFALLQHKIILVNVQCFKPTFRGQGHHFYFVEHSKRLIFGHQSSAIGVQFGRVMGVVVVQ